MTSRLRVLIAATALAFLGVHLANLPETLEDIDSINFALGVERFDPVVHQPHPPGYPVYVALAKVSTRVVGLVRPGWDRDHRAAAGLALLGAFAGALAIYVFTLFWIAVGLAPPVAFLAALVATTSPLFWLTASRPLSDTAGLVAAVAVQVLLVRAITRARATQTAVRVNVIAAGLMTGVVIGFRTQAMWLTGPLLAWLWLSLAAGRRWRNALTLAATTLLGIASWAVPLLWLSGGIGRYWAVLVGQGADDFAGPHMLAVSLTWRRLSASLAHTFVNPWDLRTFAHVVSALALIGIVRLFLKQRATLAVIAVAFLPYLVFHLAFQETITTRYALPLIVPVAALAVVALAWLGIRVASIASVAIVTASLVVGAPRLSAYAHDGFPVFRAFQAMQTSLPPQDAPELKMHHQVWWGVRRALDWYRPSWNTGPMPFPGDRERLSVVEHFRQGDTRPVWFLGHLSRTDLTAFDPRTTTLSGRYEFPLSLRRLIGGVRVESFNWWVIRQPAWMLGSGWSLTPELAGVTAEEHLSAAPPPTQAYLLRRPDAVRVLIGGRYLGPDNGPAARVNVRLDGTQIASWVASSEPRWFVQWLDLPDLMKSGDGTYATLSVETTAENGGPAAAIGFEQFDAARSSDVMAAFATGWQEREENPETGVTWRWTSDRSTLQLKGGTGDSVLTLAGDSPLKYFDAAPEVTVRAGDRVLETFRPDAAFSRAIVLPREAVTQAGGAVTITSSRTFSPSDNGSPDRRILGLRLFTVEVK